MLLLFNQSDLNVLESSAENISDLHINFSSPRKDDFTRNTMTNQKSTFKKNFFSTFAESSASAIENTKAQKSTFIERELRETADHF